VFEFGEVAVEVEGSDEFEHACGHEEHEAGDHVQAKGVGGVRVHYDRNAVVKESNGEENADAPAQPRVDVAVRVEQPAEKEGGEAIGDSGEALGESMAAMKSAADGFGEAGVNGDDEKGGKKLAGFEDDGFALGKSSDVGGFALPFAPMHQAKTFAEGGEEHDWEKVGEQDVKDAASGVGNAFPGSGGGEYQEESVKHVRKRSVANRARAQMEHLMAD